MTHAISRIRLEDRWEEQRYAHTTKTCGLNVNGRVYSYRSETRGFRINPFEAKLTYNGELIHSIIESDGTLINENGFPIVNIPSRWTLFGQQLRFSDGLVVYAPTLPLYRAKFDCNECHGEVSLLSKDYITGFYKEPICENEAPMLSRLFQLLWVTSLYGWGGG